MKKTVNNLTVYTDVEQFAKNYTKGTFGLYVGTLTEPKMNKYPKGTTPKERKTTPVNPYLGRLKKETYWKHAACGKSYYAIVKAECEREGIKFTDEEFAKAFPHEKTYAESMDNIVFTHSADIEKPIEEQRRYLRLYKSEGSERTETVSFYFLDGQLLSKDSDTYKDIKRYMSEEQGSAKQEALGMANLVHVAQYSVGNVVFMQQGNEIYINPDYAGRTVDMETVKAHFEG